MHVLGDNKILNMKIPVYLYGYFHVYLIYQSVFADSGGIIFSINFSNLSNSILNPIIIDMILSKSSSFFISVLILESIETIKGS